MIIKPDINITGGPTNGPPLHERIRDYNISMKLKQNNPEMRITVEFEREGLELVIERLDAENVKLIRDAAITAKSQERMLNHVREIQAKNKELDAKNKELDAKGEFLTKLLTSIEQQIQNAKNNDIYRI